jgi:hypothetical protein
MKKPSATRPTRRQLLGIAALGLAGAAAVLAALVYDERRSATSGPVVTVYKHPQCDCCNKWIGHLKQAGFRVEPKAEFNLKQRHAQLGVPESLGACHTALVDGYLIEGHVPVADIRRLLRERPTGRGLAVPGMPLGSPGMEAGDRFEPYDTLLFQSDGQATVFASHVRAESAP